MHDQTQADIDLQTAFDLLASLVSELSAEGRRTYAASIKPALVARTNGGFDERTLGPGFSSFRAFLGAAVKQGIVTTRQAPVGPDIEVLPPGAPDQPEQRNVSTHGRKIRRDLWEAFVKWQSGTLRAFNRTGNAALIISAEPAPLEPAHVAARRRAIRSNTHQYVPIQPLSMEHQTQIMRDFVEQLDPSAIRTMLELALTSDRPLRAFKNTLSVERRLEHQYVAFRLEVTAKIIEEWKAANHLEVDIFVGPSPHAQRDQSTEHTANQDQILDSVRTLIHLAVDRMPLEALDRLAVPAQFMIDR